MCVGVRREAVALPGSAKTRPWARSVAALLPPRPLLSLCSSSASSLGGDRLVLELEHLALELVLLVEVGHEAEPGVDALELAELVLRGCFFSGKGRRQRSASARVEGEKRGVCVCVQKRERFRSRLPVVSPGAPGGSRARWHGDLKAVELPGDQRQEAPRA